MVNGGFTLNPRILWKRYFSREPWFELISEEITSNGMVKIKCDWNSHFIKSLAEMGFTGTSEEDFVYQFIYHLARFAASRMEQQEDNGVDRSTILSAQEMANLERQHQEQSLTSPTRFVS